MKTSYLWWLGLIPVFACSSPEERAAKHDAQGNPAPQPQRTDDAVIGTSKVGLVQDQNGNWVPACSIQKSRCVGSTGYEQCSWSVERPGTEDWYRGDGCDSGYVCQQEGVEARCVTSGGGGNTTRTLRCDEMSNDELRLTVRGNPLGGGLSLDPPNPQYITYAGGPIRNENGWLVPPPSNTIRERVSYTVGSNGPWSFNIESTVTDFTPYMTDRRTPSRGSYFNVGNNVWRVEGGCTVQRDSNADSFHIHRTSMPDDDGGDGGGTSGGPGTIWCDATGSALYVTVTGPFNQNNRLLGTISSGVMEFGSNRPYAWSPTSLASNGRDYVSWTNNSDSYTLELPADADEFNLCFASYANASTCIWANLNSSSAWTVGGDCYMANTKIYVR